MPEDPYSDPVTGVLYNKFGLRSAAALEAAEREIHKRIFGDVYEWAGQIRTVAISKGAMFCLPQYIDPSAAVIFRELHDEDCLHGLRRDGFVGRLAYYLGEVNALHPFARATGGRRGPSSGSSPATPGSRSPGSTLIPSATSRPPPRSRTMLAVAASPSVYA